MTTSDDLSGESFLQFAQFLNSQEESNDFHELDEEDEAGWDQLLSDPDRVAKFGQWADGSRASASSRPEMTEGQTLAST